MQQELRTGHGTSSQNFRIVAENQNGTPSSAFYTYAEEVAIEQFIGRPIKEEVKAKATKWGNLMECVVFNALPMGYELCHKLTVLHKKYGHIWSGTPDLLSDLKVGEIKCFWIKQFILFSLALLSGDIERIKREFPGPYWQVVGNAILTKKKYAELIAFLPTKEQLRTVLDAVENTDFLKDFGLDESDYFHFRVENLEQFPYLPDNCGMDPLNTFEFEVPVEDKIFLTKKYIEFDKEVQRVLATFKQ